MIKFLRSLFTNSRIEHDVEKQQATDMVNRLSISQFPIYIRKELLIKNFKIDIHESEQWNAELLVSLNDYVIKDKSILILKPLIHGSGIIYFKAPFNCKLINLVKTENIKLNELVLIVEKLDSNNDFYLKLFEQSKKKIHLTEYAEQYDEFRKNSFFFLKNVCGVGIDGIRIYNLSKGYENEYLEFGIKSSNGHHFLTVFTNSSDFTLAKQDSLIFLFEDDSTVELVFDSRHSGSKRNYFNLINLTEHHLGLFSSKSLKKIKVESYLKNIYSVFTFSNFTENNQYETKEIGQYTFMYIFKFYINKYYI